MYNVSLCSNKLLWKHIQVLPIIKSLVFIVWSKVIATYFVHQDVQMCSMLIIYSSVHSSFTRLFLSMVLEKLLFFSFFKEGGREVGENHKAAPHPAWSLKWGSVSQSWDHDLNLNEESWTFNQLRHRGAPFCPPFNNSLIEVQSHILLFTHLKTTIQWFFFKYVHRLRNLPPQFQNFSSSLFYLTTKLHIC